MLKKYITRRQFINYGKLSLLFFLNSCSTIESSWDSVKDASDYVYDSVFFWEDEEKRFFML